MMTNKTKLALSVFTTALVLTTVVVVPVLAQGADTLGVTQVSQTAITTMKLIAVAAIGFGFMRLMTGRHTVEGLVMLGVGGLGLAKTQALVTLLGLG